MTENLPSEKSINELVNDAEDRVSNNTVANGLHGSSGNRPNAVRSRPNSTNCSATVESVRFPCGETPWPGAMAGMLLVFVTMKASPAPVVRESGIKTHDPPLF